MSPTRRGLLAGGAAALLLRPPSLAAQVSGCRRVSHEGASYAVCVYDLRTFDLRLHLADPAGQIYGSLPNLVRSPAGQGLVMAMNAGMYKVDLHPLGLYVEGGRDYSRLNLASGDGNFYLKPNGVFFVGQDGRAGIQESVAFGRRRPPKLRLATQSGPLLVIDGDLHPRISQEGPSRKRRNGVGLVDPNMVVFAISDQGVSFGAFARLFRDGLGCRNALFLDGSISALYAPEIERADISIKPLGPILGVTRR